MELRLAHAADLPAIEALAEVSGRGLSGGYYTPEQIESLVRYVFGADRQLVADGTYYVVESAGALVAGGGWSRRLTLHGGERPDGAEDPLIDPARDPARIRAFFVHPEHARKGLGRRLLAQCVEDARAAGFRALTLVATLPGEPLYRALGFHVTRRYELVLPDRVRVDVTEMGREIEGTLA